MKAFKISIISIISTLLIFLTILGSVALTAVTTPNLLPFLLRQVWDDGSPFLPEEYLVIKDDISVTKDLKYPSKYNDNYLDIY